jgi:putative transposase
MVEIVRAVKFGYDPSPETLRLLSDFRNMLNLCLERAFETNSFSIKTLHHACYGELKARYDYNTQYFVSAIKTATSILSSWKRTKGEKPKVRKLFIDFSPLLTRFDGEKLRISVRPREFITIALKFGSYQENFVRLWREGKLRIGEIQMNEHYIIIPFKQEIDLTKPNECIALDVNEDNITAVDSSGNCLRVDTSKLRAVHEAYSNKLRKIQRIGDSKVKKSLLQKYSGKRKRKICDLLHKLTKGLSELTKGKTLIMEDLRNIRKSVNRRAKKYNRFSKRVQLVSLRSKHLKRRLNVWNFRRFQFLLDYKHKLNNCDVVYLNPYRTSSLCFRCGGIIAPMRHTCPVCGLDRHLNACMNMLKMWGCSGYPESPSLSVMRLGCRGLADEVNQAELRGEVGFPTACTKTLRSQTKNSKQYKPASAKAKEP